MLIIKVIKKLTEGNLLDSTLWWSKIGSKVQNLNPSYVINYIHNFFNTIQTCQLECKRQLIIRLQYHTYEEFSLYGQSRR